MRTKSPSESGLFNPRVVLACALVSASALFSYLAFASDPASGTITTSSANLTWAGTGSGVPPAAGGDSSCDEASGNCDSFVLTIAGAPQDWANANKTVHLEINWTSPTTDYDLYVHKGSADGPVVASSGSGGTTVEQVDLNPASSSIGTGVFYVRAVYFAPNPADQYHGVASVIGGKPQFPPAKVASGPGPRFEVYNPAAEGPNTLGRASGEPSIGIGLGIPGHPEGRALFQADVQTLRVTFNDACAAPRALWENKPAATSQVDFDPILFTDRITGRTVVHLLTFAGNVIAGESSVTDTAPPFNDGDVYVPSKGSGIGSGVDHQTVGGGPYAPPLDIALTGHAVYYCSQALVDASCARSDDGGINYGPSTVTYTSECGGLHGHVKVGPDGTVYLPNKGCGTDQAVVVSEDNGATWNIRAIPDSTSAGSDPSVGIDGANRVYFGFASGDTQAAIATSTDHGMTWSKPVDVGAAFGINNVVFPAVVAGDKDRAAFAFLGTPTAGGLQGPKFSGIWHLYVATTYDGGATWKTVDATPNDPVQRGCVWLGGGSNICRNMLDFMDVQMDQKGRIMVGYADGCAGAECIQARAASTGNAYTAFASIARQSGGPRLLKAFDPAAGATAPGVPKVSAKRDGGTVQLSWSEADNGGSPITDYLIFRGTKKGAESYLDAVHGTKHSYTDNNALDKKVTYYYKVAARNAAGTSCDQDEVSARYVGDSNGAGITVAVDPTADGAAAGTPDLDIESLTIAEPPANADKLVFKLKVASLATMPNDRMWRIFWASPNALDKTQTPPVNVGQFYVGMNKEATGEITYEYGTVETTSAVAVGLPATKKAGNATGSFTPEGLITITVPKNKVGVSQVGDLLGALAVRTYPVVTDQVRTTTATDSITNATANDETANAFTYTIVGTPVSSQLLNISSRLNVGTGEDALFGGFIISGTEKKQVLVRGIGPSIKANGQPLAGRLTDPVLELHGPGGALIAQNDDWKDGQQAQIEATGLPPKNTAESAIVRTLSPGAYTVILRGKNQTTGIGLVEAYDIDQPAASELANISTRGRVTGGDNALIGGFIAGPNDTTGLRVLVRALGPSLSASNVQDPLSDPTLELFDGNGNSLAKNDNWQSNQKAAISATGLAPKKPAEAAILADLNAGAYTAIVRGKQGEKGVALVEIYALP